MFEQFLEQNILTPLDLFFADLQAKTMNERAFFAALMAVSREGHLCLDLDHLTLPDALSIPVLEGAKTASSPYIRRLGNLFYLERNFDDETRILNQLRQLSFQVKPLDYSPSGLTEEQQQALNLALANTLTIIEGGPGTGKTFLTSHLVKAMGPGAHVILAAPTGKAAARLKQFNPQSTCGTLHSILGIKSQRQLARGSSYVQADLIIIDESSMIDAKLLAFFLGSLQVGQRVVFLGDGNQLPPVESGSLFGDLVDLLPTAHLRQCLRSDRAEVLRLAQDILAGKQIAPHQKLSKEFILQKALENKDQQFCILSPVREGPFGVNVLNQEIFQLFYRQMKDLLAVPILITRTDYEAGLYNGEVGILWRSREKLLYAEFGDRKIPASALPPYELGYVLSVHKSQGSEFDHVLALVPPGSETFGREVLYTAVTRAKHSVILCGDQETIDKTISRSSHRRSGLKLRWELKDQKI
ncbi:MAG TPA: AAA family ATPase [Rhabdochlamydiaceae bacterium]|jgi:exodeoxyribonuclease V alpha subunit|nr:AAA family ATPase [Rhabdochlamydiaceae bacterium]